MSDPTEAPAAGSVLNGLTVISLIQNLMLRSQLAEGVKSLGAQHKSARSRDELLQQLADNSGAIVVFDLNAENLKPLELISELKSLAARPPIAAFFSHVHNQAQQAAHSAGADLVLPRSKFFTHLGEIALIKR